MLKDFIREIVKLYFEKKTATIYVKKDNLLKIVYIINGIFGFAQSNIKDDSLIGVIRERGILTDHQIETALKKQALEDPIGKTLLELGYLTPLQLAEITRFQQEKIFYSIFQMKEIEIKVFEDEFPPSITPMNFSLIKLLRTAIEEKIEREVLIDISPLLSIKLKAKEIKEELTEDEVYIINLFKEQKSIEEVLNRSKFDEFYTLKVITFLYYLGFLQELSEGVFEFSFDNEEKEDFRPVEFDEKIEEPLPSHEEDKKVEFSKEIEEEDYVYEEFEKEKRKTRIFLIISGIVFLLIVGATIYTFYKAKSESSKILPAETVKEKEFRVKKEPPPKKEKNVLKLPVEQIEYEKRKKKKKEENVSVEKKNSSNVSMDLTPLIRMGKIKEASIKYKNYLSDKKSYYSILLEVDCLKESVITAFKNGEYSPNIMVLPKRARGRACYAVLWGVYSSKESAQNDIPKLPTFFIKQGGISVIKIGDYFNF